MMSFSLVIEDAASCAMLSLIALYKTGAIAS